MADDDHAQTNNKPIAVHHVNQNIALKVESIKCL